jgi:hypothetical protein
MPGSLIRNRNGAPVSLVVYNIDPINSNISIKCQNQNEFHDSCAMFEFIINTSESSANSLTSFIKIKKTPNLAIRDTFQFVAVAKVCDNNSNQFWQCTVRAHIPMFNLD